MQKSHAIIGTYNHLPEGTEETAFEEVYQVCWRPFLSVLYRFPDISAVLHYSGTVLRWLEARHPEFLMLLEEMVLRKQIELLGGGFFAPLLPLTPGPDRLGQIEMLTTYIRKSFGKRPRGCWLQDYAWEPGLASTIQACGFDFTFLPERHFLLAGLPGEGLGGPAITEDQGKSLSVFPVFDAAESLSSILLPAEAIEELRSRVGELPLYSILYPGSLFRGLWESYGLESPDILFERAFSALQREGLSYETTTPSRYVRGIKRYPRAYFPGCASARLMEASLAVPAGAVEGGPSATAGSPRRLLLRHHESLALYAKMQYVRILVGQLRGDKSRKKSAQEELWRGQCGESYWSGSTGGIGRLAIRATAYSALIEAEKTTRQRGVFAPGVIMADIDFDGEKEILYQGVDINAYIHLRGGCLVELDSFRTRTNYINVMERRDSPIGNACFVDRISESGTFGPERGSFAETGYSILDSDRPAQVAVLAKEGWVEIAGRRKALSLRKTYSFRKGGLTVSYEIANLDRDLSSFRFVTEHHFAAGLDPSLVGLTGIIGRDGVGMASAARSSGTGLDCLRIENLRQDEKLELRADSPFAASHEPIFALLGDGDHGSGCSLYQGCRILLGWDVALPPDTSRQVSITLELKS